MPLLGPTDPLPHPPHRVLVAGASGAGKTTLAERIGQLAELPVFELDAAYWGPKWTKKPGFVAEIERFAATRSWVTEWQYDRVKPLLARRADTLVWLDHRLATVLGRSVRRTVARRRSREPMWSGNIEPPLWTLLTRRDHIVRWAWQSYRVCTAQLGELLSGPEGQRLSIVRLRGQREVDAWLAGPFTAAAIRAARSTTEVDRSSPT